MQVSASEARKFFRSLPKGTGPKKPSFAVAMGKSIRLSQRQSRGAVAFTGTHRVRVLEPLLASAESMRIWSDPTTGVSGWEIIFASGRFFLLLSPEVYRGFSGEGQVLAQLSQSDWQAVIDQAKAMLVDRKQIDLDRASDHLNCDRSTASAAFAVLGSRGLAGFDVESERYFYRELPFELGEIEKLQPRLKAARKLIENGGIKIAKSINDHEQDVTVPGTGVAHYVRLRDDGDVCSCPWFSKHQGERGPCKHVLAARMFTEEQQVTNG